MRFGESIHMHRNWDEVDLGRLKQLLETSFQKTLSQDYFANAAVEAVYISDSYRAGAVITRIGEVAYLDKFAVTEEAQGEGLGRTIRSTPSTSNMLTDASKAMSGTCSGAVSMISGRSANVSIRQCEHAQL